MPNHKSRDELYGNSPFPDNITRTIYNSWDDLYGMDRVEIERFQLISLQRRIEELSPRVAALKRQMNQAGLGAIRFLDAAARISSNTTYKAHLMAFLESARFDRLTQWLGDLGSLDMITSNHLRG